MYSFIVWDANPDLLNSVVTVRWYGLLFAFGFLIGQQLLIKMFKREGKSEKEAESLTIHIVIATIIGARLGHVLFYEPARYLADPISIFKVWEGGLASHGAAIGILISIYIYINYSIKVTSLFKWDIKKINRPGQTFLWAVDKIVIGVALSGCLIRFGNFINSEIVGEPSGSDYGVVFARMDSYRIENYDIVKGVSAIKGTHTIANDLPYVPVELHIEFEGNTLEKQDIEEFTNYTIAKILSRDKKDVDHIYHQLGEPLDYDISKNGGTYTAIIRTSGIARHPAQLYESLSSLIIFVLLFYIWSTRYQKIKDGTIFGIFLTVLFSLRFIYEFLKENQVAFEDGLALNMGQWLSIPLIITGIVLLVTRKGDKEKEISQ